MIRAHLASANPMKLSFEGIAETVEQAILMYKREIDDHEPISEENFADIVMEQWAEDERKRVTEELRQLYADMSEMRDRMRNLFPTLVDPTKCGSCGGSFIRGSAVAPMPNGKLKHLRCEGGADADVKARADRAESDAAWALFKDRQGGA